MSTQKAKFELFTRLQNLGFTYEEAVQLRRIEMTLQRWGELECGNSDNYKSWGIEREEETGKPFMVVRPHSEVKSHRYPVADREAGALKRLGRIVGNRNTRNWAANGGTCIAEMPSTVLPYHQGDPRGCALYLLTRGQLTEKYGSDAGKLLPIDQYYTRGLAVCC